MPSPSITEALLAGRQVTDPKALQAFNEILDRIELLYACITISPMPDANMGFGDFPNPALIVDFNDPRKKLGVGLPQLTQSEIDAIRLPPKGTIVFNLTLSGISFYTGTAWIDIY